MKEIKLKALVGDTVYFLKNENEIGKGTVNAIIMDKLGEVVYTTETFTIAGSPVYKQHVIVGLTKEDLLAELTKLINDCKI